MTFKVHIFVQESADAYLARKPSVLLELSQLDASEFAVEVLKPESATGGCGLVALQCRLRRAPAEPPLALMLPSEYPAASPLLIAAAEASRTPGADGADDAETIASGENAAAERMRDAFAERVLTRSSNPSTSSTAHTHRLAVALEALYAPPTLILLILSILGVSRNKPECLNISEIRKHFIKAKCDF